MDKASLLSFSFSIHSIFNMATHVVSMTCLNSCRSLIYSTNVTSSPLRFIRESVPAKPDRNYSGSVFNQNPSGRPVLLSQSVHSLDMKYVTFSYVSSDLKCLSTPWLCKYGSILYVSILTHPRLLRARVSTL